MRLFLAASSATLCVLATGAPAAATAYTFSNFDAPPPLQGSYEGTVVRGINDVGQVVGFTTSTGGVQGFVLNTMTGTYKLYSGSYFEGINDGGQVTGIGVRPGFVLDTTTGVFTTIPFDVAQAVTPAGINNTGQVLLSYSDGAHAFPTTHSFLYDPASGLFTTLSDPIRTTVYQQNTLPKDINDKGQIVGSVDLTVAYQGFLRDPTTGTYTNFTVPGALDTGANGINNLGQIVGFYQPTGTVDDGFLLDLATNTFTDLIEPGFVSTIPTGINDAGQIVGYTIDTAFISHGFIATPTVSSVPEPGTLALLSSAMACLVRRAVEKRRAV